MEAAEQILPMAQTLDPQAGIMKITPRGRGRYVVPKVKLKKSWYYHYTTELAAHYVDVLTEAQGTPIHAYREEHWQYPDGIDIKPR